MDIWRLYLIDYSEDFLTGESLRPVLFVVQLINDIGKQDCIHNKRIPQCTKMRFCIYHR